MIVGGRKEEEKKKKKRRRKKRGKKKRETLSQPIQSNSIRFEALCFSIYNCTLPREREREREIIYL
jgi:hypothetical protein